MFLTLYLHDGEFKKIGWALGMGIGIVSEPMLYKEAGPSLEGMAQELRDTTVNMGAGGRGGGCRDAAQPALL